MSAPRRPSSDLPILGGSGSSAAAGASPSGAGARDNRAVRRPDLRRLRRPEKAEEKFLGPLEAEVMDRLWKRRSATVRDIVVELARTRELAYTTVMTIMVRLHEKGLLERVRDGKTYVYRPAFTRAEQRIARGPEDTADVVAALVLILASCGISLGLATLFRQLAATAMLIRRLVSQKVAEPRSVAFAASGLELDGKIDVVADSRPFSFCYWFLRPRICLSTALVDRLDIDELRAVLLHERYHLRQRAPLRLVIARYFAAGLYVVPVVDELVGFFTLQKEIAADQAAVRANGVEALASALDKLLPDADDVSLGLLVPVSSLSVTEARIDQLVAGRQVSLALSPLSVALSGGALLPAAVLVAIQV